MKFTLKLTPLLLLVTLAAAQNSTTPPAQIQTLNVLRVGADLKIEITLSQPVQPGVMLANYPNRLVLDFPNTSSDARQQRKDVNEGGVKVIRFGLNSTSPLVTRLIIDLDEFRPHAIAAQGNKIIVTIPLIDKVANHRARKGAPAPAASGSLLGRLHRNPQPTIAYGDMATTGAPVLTPPALPPLNLPDTQATSTSSAKPATSSRPTAAHPSYGSLQQGTVFPSAGSPGAGTVPPLSTAAGQINPNDSAHSAANNINPTGSAGSSPTPKSAAVVGTTNGKVTPPSLPSATASTSSVTTREQALPTAAVPNSSTASKAITAPASSPDNSLEMLLAGASTLSLNTAKLAASTGAAQPLPPSPSATKSPDNAVSSASNTNTTDTVSTAAAALSASTNDSNTPTNSQPATPIVAATSNEAPPVMDAARTNSSSQPEATANDSLLPTLATRQPNSDVRMSFRVKYVTEGAAYLDGGRSAGLTEGMKLEVREVRAQSGQSPDPSHPGQQVIAELQVISVAESSAVTEIRLPQRDVKPGDYAFLSSQDTESLIAQRSLSATRKYPTVISFTEGDPLDEEAREEVPRPPLPEINRARGRFGFDYSSVVSHGAFSSTSSSTGIMMRTDITRIGGTYWNLNGYWRGRLTHSSSAGQQTLQDLLNRTYTLGLTYDNPKSPWVAGFGRLYLPYATSLDTIDGGYFGRRVNTMATIGVFAGSTPDPTSWSYNPNQEIGGMFVNFQGGSFDATRYTSTAGVGVNMLKWSINRPFVFFENGIYYKRFFSLYSAVQADRPAANAAVASPGAGLSRSFTTLRVQPIERFEFDVNHTYFRDLPTFDPTLIGTGLLDKYLFQGFSFGPRIEVVKDIWAYSSFGRSSRSGDAKASWNQMYGITLGHIPWTRVRADVHYSKFDSSFGSGKYTAMSLSRSFKDTFRWELLAGIQDYASALATNNRSHFITGTVEAPLGANFFLQGGYTWNRGGTQNYDQYLFSVGYRFDSKYKSAH